MTIYEELVKRVCEGETFHIDFEKQTMKIGKQTVINNGEYDESRTLDVHIRKLRMKLEAAGELIHTVKNIGYKLGGNENG